MSELSPLILMVDDDPQSLRVMSITLKDAGYRLAAAISGAVCFEILKNQRPDLILCDIVMPGMDGYEVCRRLKADPALADIPLMFLTAYHDPEALVEGLNVGAVDYVTKPFHPSELLARVKTHTELKRSRDLLLEATVRLEAMNERLTAINAEKDHLLGIVAHDLGNPIASVSTAHKLISRQLAKGEMPAAQLMEIIASSCKSANTLIQELLEAAELEQQKNFHLQALRIGDFLLEVARAFQERMLAKGLTLVFDNQAQELIVAVDTHKLTRAFENLLHNALKFTPEGGEVRMTLRQQASAALIDVQDSGIGIPPELQAVLFDKFTQARRNGLAGEQAHGLGMHIVREIVLQHRGRISVSSQVNLGTRFRIELPLLAG